MSRIIPGVEVKVVKEVVPQQLAPSGVLGLIGFIDKNKEKNPNEIIRAGNWNSFISECGVGSSNSIPEARQALQNGVFELVVSPLDTKEEHIAKVSIASDFIVEARSGGNWANSIKLKCYINVKGFIIELYKPEEKEILEKYNNISFIQGLNNNIRDLLENESQLIRVNTIENMELVEKSEFVALNSTAIVLIQNSDKAILSISGESNLQYKFGKNENGLYFYLRKQSGGDMIDIGSYPKIPNEWILVNLLQNIKEKNTDITFSYTFDGLGYEPTSSEYVLSGGTDANPDDYLTALNRLDDEPDVDMVLAAVQDFTDIDRVIDIYSDVLAHCQRMSEDSKGRLGFGQVRLNPDSDDVKKMAEALLSDRFVLTAPYGLIGAVAGTIGNLSYYESPTFKTLSGIGIPSEKLSLEKQREYLKSYVVPIALEKGRGLIVIRGLTTDGDQINVRRVADRAVRGVKMIGDLFIGRLNTSDGRSALKQKLIEFLTQMEREGAIVPSTDGKDPAFKLDVYSTQNDFALGIVRVELATRPVRAIDYIYAIIFVQV